SFTPTTASGAHRRRKTLCTEDGREIVPPQLPFFPPSSSPPSRRSPRPPAGPISIDVQLADAGQKIRPLPRIPIPPTPRSAPPVPHQQLSRSASMRPLPCLPESGALAISVTPATPLPPPTPTFESTTHLSPPRIRPPPRFTSLSLKVQTSPDALKPHAFESLSGPPTPTLPQPPSPRTAERRRISKLRRHLGESVQILLDRPDELDVLAELRHGVNNDVYSAVTAEKVLDFDGTDSDTSSEDDANDTVDYSWDMTRDRASSNRVSQKWIRERGNGKQRWTEHNFSKILQDLRAL
ncbi:hypothetical protein B0H13DRAFT_1962447, partial [Mycena leptocephala]